MSQENVEIVRRYLEGYWDEPPEWIAGFWESDGDYYPVRKFPEARPCHGREEVARFFIEYLAAWEGYRYVVADARAIGDDRVLVHGRVSAEGRTSGVALEGDLYHCFWLRHGRFIRVEDHLTAKARFMRSDSAPKPSKPPGLRGRRCRRRTSRSSGPSTRR